MSTVLVTGAGGMLGRDVLAALPGAVGYTRGELDVTDADAVRAAIRAAQPDVVVNCAAWTNVDGAEEHEAEATAINGTGAGNVAAAAAGAGAAVVHVSTDYVFDGTASEPYVESDHVRPATAYGRSKLAGEAEVREANPRHHVVRTAWLFGAGGPNFVGTMLRLGQERDALSVVADQTGCPTYTPHLAAALATIARSERYGTWHAAGGGRCTWFDLASATFEQAGLDVAVTPCTTAEMPRPAPRPAWSVLASERSDAVALPDWTEGLSAYLDEIRSVRR
jgi:dTDP-4-dehydrorhamnose reductase